MSRAAIGIEVGAVSHMEARVYARFVPGADADGGDAAAEQIVLRGALRGPYCERARTLPAEFAFGELAPGQFGVAEAIVTDPCLWSDELPHVYRVDVEARSGDRIIAEYHGEIGLRPTGPVKTWEIK